MESKTKNHKKYFWAKLRSYFLYNFKVSPKDTIIVLTNLFVYICAIITVPSTFTNWVSHHINNNYTSFIETASYTIIIFLAVLRIIFSLSDYPLYLNKQEVFNYISKNIKSSVSTVKILGCSLSTCEELIEHIPGNNKTLSKIEIFYKKTLFDDEQEIRENKLKEKGITLSAYQTLDTSERKQEIDTLYRFVAIDLAKSGISTILSIYPTRNEKYKVITYKTDYHFQQIHYITCELLKNSSIESPKVLRQNDFLEFILKQLNKSRNSIVLFGSSLKRYSQIIEELKEHNKDKEITIFYRKDDSNVNQNKLVKSFLNKGILAVKYPIKLSHNFRAICLDNSKYISIVPSNQHYIVKEYSPYSDYYHNLFFLKNILLESIELSKQHNKEFFVISLGYDYNDSVARRYHEELFTNSTSDSKNIVHREYLDIKNEDLTIKQLNDFNNYLKLKIESKTEPKSYLLIVDIVSRYPITCDATVKELKAEITKSYDLEMIFYHDKVTILDQHKAINDTTTMLTIPINDKFSRDRCNQIEDVINKFYIHSVYNNYVDNIIIPDSKNKIHNFKNKVHNEYHAGL